jgi:cobalt/nickel transport system permease protein
MYLDRLEFKNDLLQCIDPRCRLMAGAVLIIPAIHISHPLLLGGLILGAMICLIRDVPVVLRRLFPVNLLAFMLWVTMPLNALGRLFIGETGGISGIAGALNGALTYTLRINAAAFLYMLTVAPLGAGGLANALVKLRCPDKLAVLLLLTYRYIFVMYQRVFVSVLSMRLRQPRQTAPGQWRAYTAVFGTALISAVIRSRNIGKALRVRGFDGAFPLTRTFALKPADVFFLGGSLILACALVLLNNFLTGGTWSF